MAGIQQMERLVHKNLLLKKRRPKATCFEITLPIVLFIILVIIRKVYEKKIKNVGPFFYDNNLVFPLSHDIFGAWAPDNTSATNMAQDQTAAAVHSNQSQELTQMVCDNVRPAVLYAAPWMQHNWTYNGRNTSLANEIMRMDPTEASQWVRAALEEVQSFNIDNFIRDAEHARTTYFASEWPQRVEDAALSFEEHLAELRAEMSSGGQPGPVARRYAEYLVNDTCHPQGAMLSDWNASGITRELDTLYRWLENSGVASWVNGSQYSPALAPLRHMLGQNIFDPNTGVIRSAETFLQQEGDSIMNAVQSVLYWISHFLRKGGSTARLVSDAGLEASMREQMQYMERAMDEGGSMQTQMDSMQTAMNHRGMEQWSVMDSMQSALSELRTALGRSTTGGLSEANLTHVLSWRTRWIQSCEDLNISKTVSDLAARTATGCPFYRHKVRDSADWNITDVVRDHHVYLRNWNMTSLKHALQVAQRVVQQVSAEEVSNRLEEFLMRTQLSASQCLGSQTGCQATRISQSLGTELYNMMDCGSHRHRPTVANNSEDQEQTSGSSRDSNMGDDFNEARNYLTNELMRRKILIAPYKGEVRQLWDLMLVELANSVTGTEAPGKMHRFLQSLLRCPLVRGLVAQAGDWFFKERMMTFETEAALEQWSLDYPDEVLAGLVFRSADQATGDFPAGDLTIEYAIRLHSQYMPPTDKIVRRTRHTMFGGSARTPFYHYIDTGIAYIQDIVGRAAARLRAQREASENANITLMGRNVEAHNRTFMVRSLSVGAEQFPSPMYRLDVFVYAIQYTLPMFMVLGWIYAVSLLVKEMVYEKEKCLREVMRIMGLKTWVYWCGWIISAMAQLTMLVLIFIALMCGGRILMYSNPLIVFVFFFTYSGAIVSLAMLISACFSRAKVAAACAGLIYYSMYLPYSFFGRYEETLSLSAKCAFCLPAPTALGVGMSLIAKWELTEEGVQWENWNLPAPMTTTGAAPNNDFSLACVCQMLIIDAVVYQILAWYLEKVFPGTLGLPQPFYFPLLPSYWFGARRAAEESNTGSDITEANDGAEQRDNAQLECYESAPAGVKSLVQIRQLTKTFRGGKKALKGISLDMQENMIVGLLGHNGAGKSTTMSILTGLYPPSKGDVLVNGCSVRKDSHGVRKQLGVCFQHNALYDTLTVEEHLKLFCNLKSVPKAKIAGEVEMLLSDTGLLPKRHAPTTALSGGMKRKLSIGIALTGGSRVIALDEPTAGVDATSRREIWHLLASKKVGRTILLSTHFMDEADVLSDRIAIIAEGRLTAIGSSMALKRRFADAYMLTLVVSDRASAPKLLDVVKATVPKAEYAGSRGRELSYVLPAASRPLFASLFEKFQNEATCKDLGIETFGVSAATMEEVFLRASSVHEEGLHGCVRNTGADAVKDTAADKEAAKPLGGKDRDMDVDSQASTDSSSKGQHSNGKADDTASESVHSGNGSSNQLLLPNNGTVSASRGLAREEGSGHNTPSSSSHLAAYEGAGNEGPWSPQCMTASDGQKEASPAVKEAPIADDVVGEPVSLKSPELLDGPMLLRQQFAARFWTRARSARRDYKAWASQLALPALFVLCALIIAMILEIKQESPPLKLSTDMFIGTINGGRQSLNHHTIPILASGDAAIGSRFADAFSAAVGPNDRMLPVGLTGGHETMERYLMATTQEHLTSSYGAVSIEAHAGSAVDGRDEGAAVTLWFKNRAYHAIPAMLSVCNNARLRLLGYEDTRTEAWSHPLPKTHAMLQEDLSGDAQMMTDLMVAITVILAMGFIPASFVVHLVQEKASSGKHQQLLTGVSPLMYWVTSYCWDIVNFLMPMLFCFCIFVVFQVAAYSGENSPGIFFLLLGYGIAMTPQMYCLETLFSVPSTAYVTLICINIFTGTTTVLATTIMDMVESDTPEVKPVNAFCKAIFPWLLPNYSLGRGMIEIAMNHYVRYAAKELGICFYADQTLCNQSSLAWDVGGRFVCSLFLMSIVWFSLRVLIEWKVFSRLCTLKPKMGLQSTSSSADDNVRKEAERVDALSNGTKYAEDRLVLSHLAKTFVLKPTCGRRTDVHSVRDVSVGVRPGECFGLLGVNGAGKTTTMRMITGDTEIGRGDVYISGWDVKRNRDKARRHLGYCPQFDALPDKLTVRETLNFYAKIRGIKKDEVKVTVQSMIERMCLEAHQHRLCEHLSGGNKRKLSTAMSLLGEPDVVLLDEPSTGIDVGARRFLWDVLGEIRHRGHALVLTSHSMDECEVLCTRLTIMVGGEFRCLGSPLQLKEKYGGGYTLAVKVQQPSQEDKPSQLSEDQEANAAAAGAGLSQRTRFCEFMAEQLPQARLTEENVGLFRYRLGGGQTMGTQVIDCNEQQQQQQQEHQVPVAEIFKMFEQASQAGGALEHCISDYTLSQTTLEEVFLHFSQVAEQGQQQE